MCPNLKSLCLDLSQSGDIGSLCDAIMGLPNLKTVRLNCSNSVIPRGIIAAVTGSLSVLERLCITLDGLHPDDADILNLYLQDHKKSKCLRKLKLSPYILNVYPKIIYSIAAHPKLERLTVVRKDGIGEPLKKITCTKMVKLLSTLKHIGIRRCGMWADSLGELTPHEKCPNLLSLKIYGNSIGYLAGGFASEAIGAILRRCPSLKHINLGNTSLLKPHAIEIAKVIVETKMVVERITVGSNEIEDDGFCAIFSAVTPSIKEFYAHGCDITNKSMELLSDKLPRCNKLWGLGLNGNTEINDVGVAKLARAIRNHPSIRDVGCTIGFTAKGAQCLLKALRSCQRIRYVYLYNTGFKSASKLSDSDIAALKSFVPRNSVLIANHGISRYLKTAV